MSACAYSFVADLSTSIVRHLLQSKCSPHIVDLSLQTVLQPCSDTTCDEAGLPTSIVRYTHVLKMHGEGGAHVSTQPLKIE